MASADTLAVFTPQSNEPPSANYATFDTRNGIGVLDFDAATEESAIVRGILPRNYAGGGLTVTSYWMATSATSGDIKVGTSIERDNVAGTDLDADSFATEQTGTGTADATSGKVFSVVTTHTSGANMDSLAAGEPFRLKIARKAADGADTMTGDAELLVVEIKET
jgi:hypothetical protein